MSSQRLFQIVSLLLERGRMTAEEVAETLQVSVRTVYRDLDVLSAAGVPIYTCQGKGGGVSLMDGYVLDRAAFTEEEQRQLLTTLQELPDQEDGQALCKLSALFHRREEGWLQVNLSRWGATHWDESLFPHLRQAILERRILRFNYASAQGGIRPCKVLPARLVYKDQAWYLQAYCLEQECYCTFRLTRILDLDLPGEVFHRWLEPPELEFDGDVPPLFRLEVRLRFAPSLTHRVYDEFDLRCITPQPDGSLLVSSVFPEDNWLYSYLLSFGTGVEVLAPDSVRHTLAQMALDIAGHHQ